MIEAMLASGAASKPPLFVFTTNETPYLHFFDTADGSKLTGTPQPGPRSSVAFSPDNSQCAITYTGTNVTYLQIYDVETWAAVGSRITLKTSADTTHGIEYSPDGSRLAIALADAVRVFDTSNWAEITTGITSINPKSLSWHPDGSMLAIGGYSAPYAAVYDTTSWAQVYEVPSGYSVSQLAFSIDGTYLAIAGGRFLRILKVSDWSLNASRTSPSSSIQYNSVAINKENDQVLLGVIGTGVTTGPIEAYRFISGVLIPVLIEFAAAQQPQYSRVLFSNSGEYFSLSYYDYNAVAINRALVWGGASGPAPFPIISDKNNLLIQNCFFSN